VKDLAYVDVQSGLYYLRKVARYGMAGYRLNAHVNAMSKKGYLLAMIAVLVRRILGRPTLLTFQDGLSQDYFPRRDSWKLYQAFRLLFGLAGMEGWFKDRLQYLQGGLLNPAVHHIPKPLCPLPGFSIHTRRISPG